MKKLMLFAVISIVLGTALVYAANQYNWGTSTGAGWITPDDTTILPGQPVIIGSTTTYPTVKTSTNTPIALGGLTIAQINAIVPYSTGLFVYCSNCVETYVCVSTGTSVQSFAAVTSTSTVGAAKHPCI